MPMVPGANPVPGGVPGASGGTPGLVPEEIEKLKAAYVPLFAVQRTYQEELAKLDSAEVKAALSADEHAAAKRRLQSGYERTVEGFRRADAAMLGNARTMKLTAHEARNLTYQMNDVFQSVVLGMPPMQVLLQQGPQITQIFGGVGNTLRALGGVLTGMRLLLGGTATAVIGGAMAWDQYLKSTRAVEVALMGRGNRLGADPGMIEMAAQAGAERAGISVSRGRDIATQLIGSGQIGGRNVEGLVGISSDFAAAMRLATAEEAAAELAKLFGDPAKGAQELLGKHNLLDDATVREVQRLMAGNDTFGAQAYLLEQLRPRIDGAARASSHAVGRGWGGFKAGISNLFDGAGGAISSATGTAEKPLQERIREIEGQLDTWSRGPLASPDARGPMADRRRAAVDYLQKELAGLRDQQVEQARDAETGLSRFRGTRSLALAEPAPANATRLRERQMRDNLAALQAGLESPDLSAEQREEVARAIDGQSAALDALINRQARAVQLDRLSIQLAGEMNPLRRAEIAAIQAQMKAEEDALASGDRDKAAADARRQSLTETLAGAAGQAAAMSAEADARDKLNALVASGAVAASQADTWLERELTLRPLLAAAAQAEGQEKADLETQIRKLERAYADLARVRRQEAIQSDARASNDRIADLRLEAELIGKTAAERTRAQALAQANRWIRDQQLDPNGPEAAARRLRALNEAQAQLHRDRLQRRHDLQTSRMLAGYDAAARMAPNPIARADVEAQREYARVLRETGDAEEAAARAALVRAAAMTEARASLQDYLRDQDQQIARLRLEIALAGSSEAARVRALAIHDTEVQARQMGLEAGSREVEQMKARAAGIADLTAELERQRDAWDKVHRAAEGMIDGPIDALLKGDIKGALASFAQEFMGLYTELAWKNPLKNRMLGTNYATLEDVGGLGGILGRLFGGGREDAVSLSGASAMSPASMAVTTPMVNISTSGLSGIPLAAGLAPAANAPWAPGGPSIAAAHLQTVATGGALRADALTGLSGPFASQLSAMISEAQRVFGEGAVRVTSAFRTIERQQELWAEALAKYGSAAEARRHVAPPGSSNHNFGLAADLSYGSGMVEQWFHANAARYGLGFRMGHEPWHIEPQNAQAMRAQPTLPVAQLERLATSAEMATGQLGVFGTRAETTGQGLAAMGSTFAQALQMFGASKGPGGMLAATLLGGLFKGIGIPGFAIGGPTGGSDPTRIAGLVHEEEFVFDAAATRRIGVSNLEAIRKGTMRGYQTGGYVVGGRPAVSAGQRAAMAQAVGQAPAEQRHLIEINVSGTGDAQIAAGVRAAISAAFDQYDREVFAGRVRMVVNDDWAA